MITEERVATPYEDFVAACKEARKGALHVELRILKRAIKSQSGRETVATFIGDATSDNYYRWMIEQIKGGRAMKSPKHWVCLLCDKRFAELEQLERHDQKCTGTKKTKSGGSQ
jgi:hypothetical protein